MASAHSTDDNGAGQPAAGPDPSMQATQPRPTAYPGVATDMTTFFKVLAASLAAERERQGLSARPRDPKAQEAKDKRKADAKAAKFAEHAKAKNAAKKSGLTPLLAGAAVVAVVVGVIAFMPGGSSDLPTEVVGTWGTSAEKYADRTFEIGEEMLKFKNGSGASDFTTHPITDIRSEREGEATVYTIDYDNQGAIYEFSFVHIPPPENVIRFRNQPQVQWRKQ